MVAITMLAEVGAGMALLRLTAMSPLLEASTSGASSSSGVSKAVTLGFAQKNGWFQECPVKSMGKIRADTGVYRSAQSKICARIHPSMLSDAPPSSMISPRRQTECPILQLSNVHGGKRMPHLPHWLARACASGQPPERPQRSAAVRFVLFGHRQTRFGSWTSPELYHRWACERYPCYCTQITVQWIHTEHLDGDPSDGLDDVSKLTLPEAQLLVL